jgi:hypothetical protein
LVARRLHSRFSAVPISTIEEIVTEIYGSYDGCRVREFILLLVKRESHDRLPALPRPEVRADQHVECRASGSVSIPTRAGSAMALGLTIVGCTTPTTEVQASRPSWITSPDPSTGCRQRVAPYSVNTEVGFGPARRPHLGRFAAVGTLSTNVPPGGR